VSGPFARFVVLTGVQQDVCKCGLRQRRGTVLPALLRNDTAGAVSCLVLVAQPGVLLLLPAGGLLAKQLDSIYEGNDSALRVLRVVGPDGFQLRDGRCTCMARRVVCMLSRMCAR